MFLIFELMDYHRDQVEIARYEGQEFGYRFGYHQGRRDPDGVREPNLGIIGNYNHYNGEKI